MENKGLRQTGVDTKGPSFYQFHLPTKCPCFKAARGHNVRIFWGHTTLITSTSPKKETHGRPKQVWNLSANNGLSLGLLAGVRMRHCWQKQKRPKGSCVTQCPGQHGWWLVRITSKEYSSRLCSPTSSRISYLQLGWSGFPCPTPWCLVLR